MTILCKYNIINRKGWDCSVDLYQIKYADRNGEEKIEYAILTMDELKKAYCQLKANGCANLRPEKTDIYYNNVESIDLESLKSDSKNGILFVVVIIAAIIGIATQSLAIVIGVLGVLAIICYAITWVSINISSKLGVGLFVVAMILLVGMIISLIINPA